MNNIKFVGYQKNIDKFLSTLDLYCCFSKTESSPLAVIEALHKGLPIISTDVGDLGYHIKKGKFGYCIKHFNETLFALCPVSIKVTVQETLISRSLGQ